MRAGLHIVDVGMAYRGVPLFEGVSVNIESGQRVVVTGANGTGKTTFLKILAGLVRPVSGTIEVSVDGKSVTGVESRRRLVGYAGPDVNAYEELSARENLAFYARLRGLPSGAGEALLESVGLKRSKRGDAVRTYSSGMRQRVRLAVSLLGDPAILLWDEPSAMLDEAGRGMVADLLARHVDGGGVAMIATNDPAEIDRWGDRRIHFAA